VSPVDLHELVRPEHTALVFMECQVGVVGERSMLPPLAEAARATGMLANAGALAAAARGAGVRVVHCTAENRADGLGANRNARLLVAMRKGGSSGFTAGSLLVEVVPEIGVAESDLHMPRIHGVSPMTGTQVDPVLRNLGVRTIVAAGVSVNVGVMGLAFEAVNLGYQLVIARDAVAGVGADYVDAVFEHTFSLIATLTTTAALVEAWGRQTT
jgi:nicotinamidase-related amidase